MTRPRLTFSGRGTSSFTRVARSLREECRIPVDEVPEDRFDPQRPVLHSNLEVEDALGEFPRE